MWRALDEAVRFGFGEGIGDRWTREPALAGILPGKVDGAHLVVLRHNLVAPVTTGIDQRPDGRGFDEELFADDVEGLHAGGDRQTQLLAFEDLHEGLRRVSHVVKEPGLVADGG